MKETKLATINATPGLQMNCATAHHEFVIKGAPTMGGDGRGVDPAETLLAAVGACALVIANTFAPMKGIKINSISVDVYGDFDDYGLEFLKQENKTSKVGYSNIRSVYTIDADNTEEEIRDFIRYVEGNCPVRDTIEFPPTFETEVKIAAASG